MNDKRCCITILLLVCSGLCVLPACALEEYQYVAQWKNVVKEPYGIAVNSLNEVFVTSPKDHVIWKIDSGGSISQGFTPTIPPYGFINQAFIPYGIAVNQSDWIYVRNITGVHRFDPTLHLNPTMYYPEWVDRKNGAGIAIDSLNYVYVTTNATGWTNQDDWSTVKKFESPIALIPVIPSPYNPFLAGKDGPTMDFINGPGHWGITPSYQVRFQQMTNLTGLATDYNGDLYIADPLQNRILKVRIDTSSHDIQTYYCQYCDSRQNSTLIAVYGPRIVASPPVASPPLIEKDLSRPSGIAVDSCNGLFIADTGNSRIVKIDTQSGKVKAIIGNPGSKPGQLNSPSGVAVDGNGFVYVADTKNNNIQKFAPVQVYC